MNALEACLQARAVWQRIGCPGQQEQFVIFPDHYYGPVEAIKGRRADRPRKRKRRK